MNCVLTESDYSEALKSEFNLEIQYEAFGFNQALSVTVRNCEYHNANINDVSNESNVKIDLNSHFPN